MNHRKIFIHIGTHKTGTKSLQTFLGNRIKELRRQGILYPRTGWNLYHAPAQHNIAWELAEVPHFDPHLGTIRDLRAELSRHDGNVVISSEDFTGAIHNHARFTDFLNLLRTDGFDIVLVLFLRNQASHVISMYHMFLRLGYELDFGEFLDSICTLGGVNYRHWQIPYHYDRYIETLLAFPAELCIRSYDSGRRHDNLLEVFLKACGIDGALFRDAVLPQENTGLTVWEGLRAFHLARFGHVTPALDAVFDVAEYSLPDCNPYRRHEQVRLEECFGESNQRLHKLWGIELDPLLSSEQTGERPLTSMSELFSTEFHKLLSSMTALDQVACLEREALRLRTHYESTLTWRLSAPLRAIPGHLRKIAKSAKGFFYLRAL